MEQQQCAFPQRFQKDHVVGNGFTGQVWAVKDHNNHGNVVAVKTISRQLYESHNLSFPPLEASMAQLSHENIVRLLEVLHEPECIFLVQEHLLGGDLFSCMQETGVFSEFLARCCFSDIVQGISYIHEKGIVHRDLKPENCVLDLNGTVKIIDFGFATMFVQGQLLTEFCGSPDYIAPEVSREAPHEGPPIDIWAVGVILYDMVMGDLPFVNADPIVFTIPETLETCVSTELFSLIGGILTEDPRHRLPASEIFISSWMNLSSCCHSDSEMELVSMSDSTTSSSLRVTLSSESPLRQRVAFERSNMMKSDSGFQNNVQTKNSLNSRECFDASIFYL
jgi:serine/threonine protein kinase